jgi:hypothetical protein
MRGMLSNKSKSTEPCQCNARRDKEGGERGCNIFEGVSAVKILTLILRHDLLPYQATVAILNLQRKGNLGRIGGLGSSRSA